MALQKVPENSDFAIEQLSVDEVEDISSILTDIFTHDIAGNSTDFGRLDFQHYVEAQNIIARIDRGYEVWVGKKLGKTAAIAELAPPSHVTLLFVGKEFRGTGIGRKLFDFVLNRISIINYNLSVVEVTVNSVPASAGFYRHFGFEVNGEEKYREGILNIPMVKRMRND